MSLYNVKRWAVRNVPGMDGLQAFLYRFKPYSSKFRTYYVHKSWGSDMESASGHGSSMAATAEVRHALPGLWQEYGIRSVLDIPCGDFHWMKEVPRNGIHYIGGDIVPELVADNQRRYASPNVEFRELDMLKGNLPKVDLIFCRDCFIHYPDRYVYAAMDRFVASGSRYLLISTYPDLSENQDLATPGLARQINLSIAPFHFPSPLLTIDERSEGKVMALWELRDLAPKLAR